MCRSHAPAAAGSSASECDRMPSTPRGFFASFYASRRIRESCGGDETPKRHGNRDSTTRFPGLRRSPCRRRARTHDGACRISPVIVPTTLIRQFSCASMASGCTRDTNFHQFMFLESSIHCGFSDPIGPRYDSFPASNSSMRRTADRRGRQQSQ